MYQLFEIGYMDLYNRKLWLGKLDLKVKETDKHMGRAYKHSHQRQIY